MDIHQNSNTLRFDENRIELLKNANSKMGLSDTTIKNIVFVYTPPKVGSTTLVSSIRLSAAYKFRVIHLHDEEMLNVLTGITDVTINELIKYNRYIGRNIYVIDVYREPLERKMSEFFDKLASFHFNNTAEKINKYNVNRLIARFNNIFTHIATGDHYFDKMTDVIKPSVFDFEKKHLIQKVFDITYIKLRLRDSAEWGKILSGIFGSEITIVNDYEMNKTSLKELYQGFKNAYKIPSNYVTYIENCTYFKYYLSPDEQAAYISNLKAKESAPVTGYSQREYNIYINICLENQWDTTIDTNHYLDEGCTCRICSKQRRIIVAKARRGEPPNEKLTHGLAVQKSNAVQLANAIQHPMPQPNRTIHSRNPNISNRRNNLQKKGSALKHGLMDNILETRINPW
jgi:hypothetical protein